jgi:Tat protein translocase TatB subunit
VLNVGTPELLVIVMVALLVLGPDKLPEVARKVGNVVGELRRMSAGFQAEMRDALQEPVHLPPAKPVASTDVAPSGDVDSPDVPPPVEPPGPGDECGHETRPD